LKVMIKIEKNIIPLTEEVVIIKGGEGVVL
jgi:hypothetical protein